MKEINSKSNYAVCHIKRDGTLKCLPNKKVHAYVNFKKFETALSFFLKSLIRLSFIFLLVVKAIQTDFYCFYCYISITGSCHIQIFLFCIYINCYIDLFNYKDGTLEEEMALLRRTEAEINKIMAHHSPVLIIQRHIRGVLTRKRYEK